MQVTVAAGQKWSLTQDAFDGLLAALGPDRESAGRLYVRIRRDLVRLFEWRGCSTPDDYADETMNRCARKIAEGEVIRDIATYSIGVARMLLREMVRDRARHVRPLDDVPEPCVTWSETAIDIETRLESLRRSLARLSAEDRHLILNYYEGDKNEKIRGRKMLMERLCIPASTLRMRALRVREKLQLWTEKKSRPVEKGSRHGTGMSLQWRAVAQEESVSRTRGFLSMFAYPFPTHES
jgi:DNA-directed RNA polymerase specialized sigma24 family protein